MGGDAQAVDDPVRPGARLGILGAEILQLLAERKRVADIQSQLYVSKGTARAHIAHIYRKMDLHTRGELLELLGLE